MKMIMCWILLALCLFFGLYPFAHHSPLMAYAVSNIAVVLCLIHCSMWAGWRTTIKMFLFSALFGGFVEVLGVNFQYLYCNYYYPDAINGPMVLGVPIMVMVSYFSLGYACFIMGRVLVGGLSNKVHGMRWLGVTIFAALAMTTHDFSNDPFMSTVKGLWIWRDGGAYFGVPLSNFIGWFINTGMIAAVVGLFANSDQAMKHISVPQNPNFFLPPILLYLVFEIPVMLRPITIDPSAINLAGSGIAMFATTIPVMAALLVLYGQNSQQDRP